MNYLIKHLRDFDDLERGNFFDYKRPFFNNLLSDRSFLKIEKYEDDQNYYLDIEAPGVEKDNVFINYEKGKLIVTTKREEKGEKKENGRVFESEFYYGEAKRSFDLGDDVNQDNIEAELKNGVLKVILPKKERGPAKQIPIKAS